MNELTVVSIFAASGCQEFQAEGSADSILLDLGDLVKDLAWESLALIDTFRHFPVIRAIQGGRLASRLFVRRRLGLLVIGRN